MIMKKGLFVLCFFIASFLEANSQIKNQILGFTFGESTKNDVINYCKKDGRNYDTRENAVHLSDVTFGGVKWERVSFGFYKDILFQVGFVKPGDELPQAVLEQDWKKLYETLKAKYSNYLLPQENNKNNLIFCDEKIALMVKYDTSIFDSEVKDLLLLYVDKELQDIKSNDEANEL